MSDGKGDWAVAQVLPGCHLNERSHGASGGSVPGRGEAGECSLRWVDTVFQGQRGQDRHWQRAAASSRGISVPQSAR